MGSILHWVLSKFQVNKFMIMTLKYWLHFSELEAWSSGLGLSINKKPLRHFLLRHSGFFHGAVRIMLSCGHLVTLWSPSFSSPSVCCRIRRGGGGGGGGDLSQNDTMDDQWKWMSTWNSLNPINFNQHWNLFSRSCLCPKCLVRVNTEKRVTLLCARPKASPRNSIQESVVR